MFKQCDNCGEYVQQERGHKFCPFCGQIFKAKKKAPYVGTHKDSAIYRITFDPVETKHTSKDAAEEAAQGAFWDVDRKFPGYKVEYVKSAVEDHSYICGNCWDFVSRTTEGRCAGCGKVQWEKKVEKKK